ncbi:hypothetical protein LOTGIDRAFT_231098 [Lottia gigantea]|uniref:SH3 domain-containing protein n=1 Tax=Lottia gigantea TaxID=225164 RepID=V4A6E8_LOTGI|nr:hypothetical protein LOTGIDRAFT_231098 [Lottia gigantea]ESO99483.1 hypothetical protein LOTGIDRAFT_231098 [Lottia gigantea]
MEVYEAIADFVRPTENPYQKSPGSYNNVLEFCKGDQFEIFHSGTLTQWWGAKALKDSTTGYVPAKYMKYVKKLDGSDIPENYIIFEPIFFLKTLELLTTRTSTGSLNLGATSLATTVLGHGNMGIFIYKKGMVKVEC